MLYAILVKQSNGFFLASLLEEKQVTDEIKASEYFIQLEDLEYSEKELKAATFILKNLNKSVSDLELEMQRMIKLIAEGNARFMDSSHKAIDCLNAKYNTYLALANRFASGYADLTAYINYSLDKAVSNIENKDVRYDIKTLHTISKLLG